MAGKEIEKLVKQIAKLPSLGTRSSRRIVLQLLKKRENLLLPLIESLNEVAAKVQTCEICGNIFSGEPVTGKAYTGQSKRGITDVSLISRTYKRGISIREASDGRICRNGNSDRSSSGDRVSGSLYADYAGSH